MSTLTELRQERSTLHSTVVDMLDRARREGRDLTTVEDRSYMAANRDLDLLDESIQRIRDREERNGQVDSALDRINSRPSSGVSPRANASNAALDREFRNIIANRDPRPVDVFPTERRSGYQPGLEQRTLATTSGSGLLGVSFHDRIVRHLVASSSILSAGATVVQSDTGEPLRIPRSTATSSATIVAEGGPIIESDPALGSVVLGGFKYACRFQVSYELANDVAFDLLSYLAEQAGQALGNAFGQDCISGVGTTEPRGLLLDTTAGVTGATGKAGAFTADDLITLRYSVAEPYSRSASAGWLMNQSTLGAVRKLKNVVDGTYLFNTESNTLLGAPVYCNPSMPAVALSAESVVFGDLSRYWVRQVGGLRYERDDSVGFVNDMINFRCVARLDGALVDLSGAVKSFLGAAT